MSSASAASAAAANANARQRQAYSQGSLSRALYTSGMSGDQVTSTQVQLLQGFPSMYNRMGANVGKPAGGEAVEDPAVAARAAKQEQIAATEQQLKALESAPYPGGGTYGALTPEELQGITDGSHMFGDEVTAHAKQILELRRLVEYMKGELSQMKGGAKGKKGKGKGKSKRKGKTVRKTNKKRKTRSKRGVTRKGRGRH